MSRTLPTSASFQPPVSQFIRRLGLGSANYPVLATISSSTFCDSTSCLLNHVWSLSIMCLAILATMARERTIEDATVSVCNFPFYSLSLIDFTPTHGTDASQAAQAPVPDDPKRLSRTHDSYSMNQCRVVEAIIGANRDYAQHMHIKPLNQVTGRKRVQAYTDPDNQSNIFSTALSHPSTPMRATIHNESVYPLTTTTSPCPSPWAQQPVSTISSGSPARRQT